MKEQKIPVNLGLVACGSDGGKGTSCASTVLVQ